MFPNLVFSKLESETALLAKCVCLHKDFDCGFSTAVSVPTQLYSTGQHKLNKESERIENSRDFKLYGLCIFLSKKIWLYSLDG